MTLIPHSSKPSKHPSRSSIDTPPQEQLFNDAESYFFALKDSINDAKYCIDMEVYIYENNTLGLRVAEILKSAAGRGVTVRLLTDGIGIDDKFKAIADDLTQHGVQVRIHRPLPWKLEQWRYAVIKTHGIRKLLYLLLSINKRNHRKTVIIDKHFAFIGSINISVNHLHNEHGGAHWRDTAIKISGGNLSALEQAFDASWNYSKQKVKRIITKTALKSNFLLNYNRIMRKHHHRLLLRLINHAQHHIFITNAYFVPEPALLKALTSAAQRGVNVQIIVPEHSDVIFMPWVSAYFYKSLLQSGAHIYEYQPVMLHAKTIMIDEWASIGSSNMNHRSFRHDLEVDYVLQTKEAKQQLLDDFHHDCSYTTKQTLSSLAKQPLWKRVAGSLILLLFGRWL
ncbi:MAG: phosphatidylserine/phosphatidylglycerophosphate/cardiolipin synthase family protein [Oleiphilaceae bacterium]|nr:phosphatidylserine/phosphatidylglycerophosphate/cardiolipin synthase family protein [Oleiphilaceae bacterium]